MGSYAQCWLGNFFVGSSKNDVDPSLVHLFRKTDQKIDSELTDDLPIQLRHWFLESEADDDTEVVYYSIPVSILRDRLELLGYTIGNCTRAFMAALAADVSQQEEWSGSTHADIVDAFAERTSVLRAMSVEAWVDALQRIRSAGLQPNRFGRFEGINQDPLLSYMLSHDWYGLPGVDRNVGLRLALDVVPDTERFVYDVTDLILSGYFEAGEDLVDYGLQLSADEFSSKSKIVVLTEGKSDSWILSESLSLLYPHLAEYFSFLDFDGSRTAGGVGNLVNLVKAFSGAGIVNRMIAIFDNDTAAAAAIRSISTIVLPRHIAVLKLPQLHFLDNYPTLGPTGVAHTNINGLATSIELVLGKDVLEDDEFGFIPVQWTGYEQGLKQYQGEVLRKALIHERFREKVRLARECGSVSAGDWDGLRALFASMFSAFNDLDGELLLAFANPEGQLGLAN